jgi:hypothetical protein
MDAARQLQTSLNKIQTAIDELTAKLAEQQCQLLAASAALDRLAAQIAAVEHGDRYGAPSPVRS